MNFSWHRFRASLAALQAGHVTDHPTVTVVQSAAARLKTKPQAIIAAIPKIVAAIPEDPAAIEQCEKTRIAGNVARIRLAAGLDSPPTDPVVQRIAEHAAGISRR